MRTIPRLTRISGTISVPPSRDETLRSLLRAAVAAETVTVANGLDMDDTRYVLETIRKLGFEVSDSFRDGIAIGERVSIYANEVDIDVDDAEPAFRWLLPFLCFTPGRTMLRCSGPLEIAPAVENLRSLDAEIEYPYGEGEPPLQIRGKIIRGGRDIAPGDEVTVAVLKVMAANFRDGLSIAGAQVPVEPTPGRIEVPPDPFLTACWQALVERVGGDVTLNGSPIDTGGGRLTEIAPRTGMEKAAWDAIGGLATGNVEISADASLARAFPHFWRVFDEVVRAST